MTPDPLTSPDTVIVFAQALTGLGHLRVTQALYRGLPRGSNASLLNSQDEHINSIHRITSIHPILRRLMEASQSGLFEDIFTRVMRVYFRSHTRILEAQLRTIVDERVIKPKTLIVVATHTILGHQIAAIKDKFEKDNQIHLVLIVVVTDDSPQHIWAVGGADLTYVPSDYTKRQLELYHRSQKNMQPTTYVTAPYMVSPTFGVRLTDEMFHRRRDQMHPDKHTDIHMSIPISGAAVQLSYFDHLMAHLNRLSDRFVYHIVSKHSAGTRDFLNIQIGKPRVHLSVSESHRDVVALYERVYEEVPISLEVTKPSEQTFKALCPPRERGGSILLFSDPVGRQEWDNIRFLLRHRLIPSNREQRELWHLAQTDKPIDESIRVLALGWRGLRLPSRSRASAQFICWCLRVGLFAEMMRFSGYADSPDLSSHGVELFWKQISNFLRTFAI